MTKPEAAIVADLVKALEPFAAFAELLNIGNYRRANEALASAKRLDLDGAKETDATLAGAAPVLGSQRMEIAELQKFRLGVLEALGRPNSTIPIPDMVRRLAQEAQYFRVMARDATAEREAWVQNAKAATGGKVENPRQLDAYIDGLKEKLNDVANIVRDYVPPSRPKYEFPDNPKPKKPPPQPPPSNDQ